MPLNVPKYLVGKKYRVAAIESLLDIGSSEICMVGIYGLPGVGKTTIAKAVYNRIAKKFDGSSFLEKVRENLGTPAGIITLQEQLLNNILGSGNWKVGRLTRISLIEKRLCCKKVLLILDDVDDLKSMEKLLGNCNWFAPGSRAIITLRDRHLLTVLKEKVCTTYKVEEFKVEQLNRHEALELFKEHAFPGKEPDEDYSKLATKFVHFANGLPLALEIIARDLCGRDKDEWESALDMYNKIPNKDIQNILQVSYEGLQDTEKDIFLDIACFFKGWDKDYVVMILNAWELYPGSGIPRLINKCLITVDQYGRLSMHDLIQQMGREVVRREEPNILGNRSRLYCYKDSLEVLTENEGSKKVRGIMLHLPQSMEVKLDTEAFRRMKNLKFLIFENVQICKPLEFLPSSLILLKWPNCPLHWPFKYFPKQLVAIEMPHSCIRIPKLIKQELLLGNLIDLNLSGCELIIELPKLCAPKLEKLELSFCEKLVKLPKLWAPKLEKLYLYDCKNLVKLPKLWAPNLDALLLIRCENLVKLPKLWAPKLVALDLSFCKKLVKLPKLWAPNLDDLNLECCENLVKLSNSGVPNLVKLSLFLCENLVQLSKLRAPNIRDLSLETCKNLVKLSKIWAPNLGSLRIWDCENLFEIDESFGSLEKLESWEIHDCEKLQSLPSQLRLKSLTYFDLSNCSRLEQLPNFHQEMKCLKSLNIHRCGIREVPSSIEHLIKLEELRLDDCNNLEEWMSSTAKLRPMCDSFDSSSGYGFVKMKPDFLPAFERIYLSSTNIVTIPESISRCPRLETLSIDDCKLLREIQGLPQSISNVSARNCMMLDTQSASGLLNQVIEIIGISPNRVCGSARSNRLMGPQFTNGFPSETEGVEYEDLDVSRTICVSGTEIPKWFNHQSVENSIFFWVGPKFKKLAFCVDLVQETEVLALFVDFFISINGCKECEYRGWGYYPWWRNPNVLLLFSPIQRHLQQQLNESNPTDKNRVEVTYIILEFITLPIRTVIQRWGVHVECTCPPNLPILTAGHDDDDVVDYMCELPFYGFDVKEEFQCPLVLHDDDDDDDVDYMHELPLYGSDVKEEFQSPMLHDETSMSCMSWLVGPTTKLFKLFCFCCP